ncbi:MAG: PilZ domain-containing protein [Candidatus Omnitrophica bacterium]|nr:PilZ domain-containing protein [Candidatus Omnitrophota bacterium]
MPFADRRKHPRVPEHIPCEVSVGSEIYSTQTKNLSCGGALCVLSQSVAPMTKLDLVLEMPSVPGMGALPRQMVHCGGVVVRQDRMPLSENPEYLTAIFFSDLKETDRRRIGEFVLRSMLEHDRRRS